MGIPDLDTVKFCEIWDDFSPYEKEAICEHLNIVQDRIHYHPGLLGITDAATVLSTLAIPRYIIPERYFWGRIKNAVLDHGYRINSRYAVGEDREYYEITR